MPGDVHGLNNIETRAVINFLFLQGKAPKEIHAILTETLGNMHDRKCMASLNVVIFPPVMRLVLDDPKQ